MAASGMMSPVRIAWPVFGSLTKTVRRSLMMCGLVHVALPSVDLMNATLNAVTLKGGVIRSKVTDSVSLKNWKLGSLSAIRTLRFFHVSPPSVEVAAATALLLFDALNEIDTVYAIPNGWVLGFIAGPMETHGSDARS